MVGWGGDSCAGCLAEGIGKVVSEVVILPEMIEAGVEAMKESEASGAGERNTVILVYLAMRAIEEMLVQKTDGTLH